MLRIRKYTHGMSVSCTLHNYAEILGHIESHTSKYEWVRRPPRWRPQRIATKNFHLKLRRVLWLPVECIDIVEATIVKFGIKPDKVSITEAERHDAKKIDFDWIETWGLREEQEIIMPKMLSADPSTLSNLQTGKGKTLSALYAMSRIGVKTVIQAKASHVKSWLSTIGKYIRYDSGDVVNIDSSKKLMAIVESALNGHDDGAKIYLISSKLVEIFIKNYEDYGVEYTGVHPIGLWSTLGVGLMIIDEVHEAIDKTAQQMAVTHIGKIIMLSATIQDEVEHDPFVCSIVKYMIPKRYWTPSVKYDAYVHARGLYYRHLPNTKIVTTLPNDIKYSHAEYEKWLLMDQGRISRYMKMCIERLLMKTIGAKDYIPGQKGVVFFSLKEMCELAKNMTINIVGDLYVVDSFIDGKHVDVLKDSDLIFTTLGSCGTGKDIPDLRYLLSARAVSKKGSNEQLKGRLRRLARYPELTPLMEYLIAEDIEKHAKYTENKLQDYKGRVKVHDFETLDNVI